MIHLILIWGAMSIWAVGIVAVMGGIIRWLDYRNELPRKYTTPHPFVYGVTTAIVAMAGGIVILFSVVGILVFALKELGS